MADFTHVLFDFFGTLVSYDQRLAGTRLERSHGLLRQAGCALQYESQSERNTGWQRSCSSAAPTAVCARRRRRTYRSVEKQAAKSLAAGHRLSRGVGRTRHGWNLVAASDLDTLRGPDHC
jgi:hypothetical protein